MRVAPLAFALTLLLAASPAAAGPSIADLQKDRATTAEKAYKTSVNLHQVGRVTTETIYLWSARWLDADLAATPRNAKQLLADHLKRMQDLEAQTQKLFTSGQVNGLDNDAATYFRLEAEIWVARGKR
jgi:hypothetical protein